MKKRNEFDLLIFDFDGTLADSRLNITNSINYALESRGLPRVKPAAVYPYIGKLSLEKTFFSFFPQLLDSDVVFLIDKFFEYQRKHAVEEVTLYPGVVKTLTYLRASGKTLAILTLKHIIQINLILEGLRLSNFFSAVHGEGLGVREKPHRDSVEYIWKNSGKNFSTHNTLLIGDSEVDVYTARNAHIDMIGTAYGIDGKEVLQQQGVAHIIDTFSELSDLSFYE